jgi:PAS domain S-box-containing protein
VGQQVGQFVVRKQAEDTLQSTSMLQQAILDGASVAIISTSTDGTIQTFNRAAERMLGYTASELVGRATPEVFHDPGEVTARAEELTRELGRTVDPGFGVFVARAKSGTPDEREWTYIRKDGSRCSVQLAVTALIDRDGRVSGYLGVASDITERKRAAHELMDAKEAAEAANRAKGDFLATISHEIRTPLNGIIGLADILAMSPLDDEQSRQLRLLMGSGQSLLALINDLLDFSKIEAGRLDLEARDFDPAAELGGIVETLRPLAKSKDLELASSFENLPPMLRGDSLRLRQILSNLLSNAIKFTPSGRVSVDVHAQREGTGWRLHMAVADTGIGIDEEAMQRIFEPFTQADASVSRKFGGTGLGLAICRRLARAMDGDITAEASPGGTVFRAHILLGEGTGAALPSHGAGASDVPDLKILVVDDNEVNRMVATTLLRKMGQAAKSAAGGAEAVEAAASGGLDIIFMDMQMPGMDGVEATARIRRLPLANQPRIVALTANAYDTDRRRCLEAGMDGFVSKPIRLEDLRAELCKVCGRAADCGTV